ncbi:hypothetical protein Ddc_10452 [Ditylenchus destructor]|nr:hypothetical protein Ddc_10452 [Ditylenchus destructor]
MNTIKQPATIQLSKSAVLYFTLSIFHNAFLPRNNLRNPLNFQSNTKITFKFAPFPKRHFNNWASNLRVGDKRKPERAQPKERQSCDGYCSGVFSVRRAASQPPFYILLQGSSGKCCSPNQFFVSRSLYHCYCHGRYARILNCFGLSCAATALWPNLGKSALKNMSGLSLSKQ